MPYIVGMVIFSIYAIYSLDFIFAPEKLQIKVLGLVVKEISYENIDKVSSNPLGGLTIFLKKGFPSRVYIFSFKNREVREKLDEILNKKEKSNNES